MALNNPLVNSLLYSKEIRLDSYTGNWRRLSDYSYKLLNVLDLIKW